MLEYTFEQVKIFLLISLILTVLYLILYRNKGIDKTFKGYISAIRSCIMYTTCAAFIIVGFGILIKIINQRTGYIGILVPVVWWLICIEIVKRCIEKDFNFKIYKFDIRNYTLQIVGFMFKIAGIAFAILCFWAAYDSRENTFQVIVLVIVGLIFGIVGQFFYDIIYGEPKDIKKKDEDK